MTAAPIRPTHRFLKMSLGAWVSQLVEEFPGFDEYDISELIEERTGLPVTLEDFEMVRALYLRFKLRAWAPETDAEEE